MKNLLLLVILLQSCNFGRPLSESVTSETAGTSVQNCPSEETIQNFLHKLEKFSWTSLMGSKMAERFVERYMSCTGEKIELTEVEFYALNPKFEPPKDEFEIVNGLIKQLKECKNGSSFGRFRSRRLAHSEGATVGAFKVDIDVKVKCLKTDNNTYKFNLEVNLSFADSWDFNESLHRPKASQAKVTVARKYLTGIPFDVVGKLSFDRVGEFNSDQKFPKIAHEVFRLYDNSLTRLYSEDEMLEYSSFGKFIRLVFGAIYN